jgi:hypothetical protein
MTRSIVVAVLAVLVSAVPARAQNLDLQFAQAQARADLNYSQQRNKILLDAQLRINQLDTQSYLYPAQQANNNAAKVLLATQVNNQLSQLTLSYMQDAQNRQLAYQIAVQQFWAQRAQAQAAANWAAYQQYMANQQAAYQRALSQRGRHR